MSEQAKSCIALGTLQNFREGWAIVPFMGKPHYWRDCGEMMFFDGRLYESNCGLRRGLLGTQKPIVPGNFTKCKRCQRSMKGRPE